MPEPMSPEAVGSYLKFAPPPHIKIVECMNQERVKDILKLFSKISSLTHFNQLPADYFTQDHALEPALTVLCGVSRINLDVSGVLEKSAATFMSLAQPLDKHRSAENNDVYQRRNFPKRADSVRTRTQGGLSCVPKKWV